MIGNILAKLPHMPKISWRRARLNSWVRLGIVAALALLLAPAGFLTYAAYQTPDTLIQQVPAWGWVHWGEWDYRVLVRPNSLYTEEVLGPDLTYYEDLVEGIEARFTYNFVTDTAARIQGTYEIREDLEIGDGLTERRIIVPETTFFVEQGSEYALDLPLSIDRQAYLDRIAQVASETGLGLRRGSQVTYTANVETLAVSGADFVERSMELTLTVPLSTAAGETFTITGDRSQYDNGVIRLSRRLPRPEVAQWRLYSTIGLAVVALLPGIAFLVTANKPPTEDAATREANRLRRRHRKLIAQAGPDYAALPGDQRVGLAGMPDLVRVAQELLKPIVYVGPGEAGGGVGQHIFFIVDGAVRYEHRLPSDTPAISVNGAKPPVQTVTKKGRNRRLRKSKKAKNLRR